MTQNILITGAAGYMYATLCRSVLLVTNKGTVVARFWQTSCPVKMVPSNRQKYLP